MAAKRAAIYARFSSDLQKDRSVDDQWDLCQRYAEREGIKVADRFCDRAKTGTTMKARDGLIAMMAAAKAGKFDAIIVESLSRLSRDQEDLAGLYKRLRHYGVDLITVHEGKANSIHVGLRGIMSEMEVKDLADRIKRSQNPMVREGLFPGAVTYGYERVWDEETRTYRPGVRVINQEKARVIRRIFSEYASGTSPREIAARLTREASPRRVAASNGATRV
jgi:DNA invertase Pin-like site-specific DNA recombinase